MRRAVKRLLEPGANGGGRQAVEAGRGGGGLGLVVHDVAGDAVIDHLRHRTGGESDGGRAACHRLDHDQAEWLRPLDRQQQGLGAAEEVGLLGVADFTDHLDLVAIDHRPDGGFKVFAVDPIDFGGDLQLHAARAGDPDGAVGRFFRADAAQEREVVARDLPRRQQVGRQSVMDGADEIATRQWPPLGIRNGDQRRSVEAVIDAGQFRQIQPPVQSGHEGRWLAA